jgi:hypothetical protein
LEKRTAEYWTERLRIITLNRAEYSERRMICSIFGILIKNKVKIGFASIRSKMKRQIRKDADLFSVCDEKRGVNNTKRILIFLREVNNRKRERCEKRWPSSTADSI